MDWDEWRPIYEEIVADFGFERKADEAARDELAMMLRGRADPTARLRSTFSGRTTTIVGAGRPIEPRGLAPPIVVADKAVTTFAAAGGKPDMVVTDLDGDPPLLVDLSARGIPLAVHAHGDNREALARWVPHLRGPVLGTTQVEPRDGLVNAGGFTDGDRACFLAERFGAREIRLVGFDFERAASERKLRKLAWARRLVARLRVPARVG